ncbi:MAG: hypothetical protein DWQ05_05745 [Calditrichaeota bacterium]|nr:MAG: hypothetical protein DWQ05_05745 [Calditrichota bacterium]
MKNTKLRLLNLSVLATIGLSIIGCDSTQFVSPNTAEEITIEQSSNKEIRFLKLAEVDPFLAKIISATEYITHKDGGELKLDYIEPVNDNPLKIMVSLTVKAGTISQDASLSLNVDDEGYLVGSLDVNFGPHGITFSEPAVLNITVENADLSGLDAETLRVVYDDTDTGIWEDMEYKELKIDQAAGKLELVEAQIPHFSRYAIAHSR